MLVLAGVELIFFIAVSLRLCFGFVLKTLWVMRRCAEQCLHGVLCASHTAPPVSRLGMQKKLGGDTAGTADPNRPKGCSIPYDVSSAHKAGGRRKRWTFRVMVFVFPSNRYA